MVQTKKLNPNKFTKKKLREMSKTENVASASDRKNCIQTDFQSFKIPRNLTKCTISAQNAFC